MRRRNELYFDFTSTSANGALAFGGGGGGGVDAGEVSGGSVSSTHATGRSGFGVRCSSSDMRSTRAARSSWELKYSMHKNERDLRGKLLNFGQLKFPWFVSSWPWMRIVPTLSWRSSTLHSRRSLRVRCAICRRAFNFEHLRCGCRVTIAGWNTC